MQLFLTSAGLPPETRGVFLDLLAKPPQETSVAFIPTAANPETDKSYVQKSLDELTDIGCKTVEVDLENQTPDSLRKILAPFDVIYMNGGNTFYLLDRVRKSGFDRLLPELLAQNKIYVGVSAGSIIMGPNIELAGWNADWDKNIVELHDLTGLNLIPFVISPHFVEMDRELLANRAPHAGYRVLALTNEQALLIQDGNHALVGPGTFFWFPETGIDA